MDGVSELLYSDESSQVLDLLRDAGVTGAVQVNRGSHPMLHAAYGDAPLLVQTAREAGLTVVGGHNRVWGSITAGGPTLLGIRADRAAPTWTLRAVAQVLLDWRDDLEAGRIPPLVAAEHPEFANWGKVIPPCPLDDLIAAFDGRYAAANAVAYFARFLLVEGTFGTVPEFRPEADLAPVFCEDSNLHDCFLVSSDNTVTGPATHLLAHLDVLDLARREEQLERTQRAARHVTRRPAGDSPSVGH